MKTRALLLSASAMVLLASPAAARNSAWYVGGDFGGAIVEDLQFDFGAAPVIPVGSSSQIVLNHDYGYDGALFVGYDLGAFRVEAEVGYKRANVNDIDASFAAPPLFPVPFTGVQGTGSTSALSFMVNGMLDFGDEDGLSGFAGIGLGFANVKFDAGRNIPPFVQVLDASDTAFAQQVIAGVRQAITDNIDITVRYRFFNADNIRTVDFRGLESESRFQSHSLLAGITFNFNVTQPEPPPIPSPPPAPLETPPPGGG